MANVIKVKITGLAEFKKALDELPKVLQTRIVDGATRAAANVIRDQARINAPVRTDGRRKRITKGKDVFREPGNLKKRIVATRQKNTSYASRWQVRASRDAWYGAYVEKGTKHQSPTKPWLRPAYEEKKTDAVKAFAGKLGQGLALETKRLGRGINLRYLSRGRY